jgi:hypothetical protein
MLSGTCVIQAQVTATMETLRCGHDLAGLLVEHCQPDGLVLIFTCLCRLWTAPLAAWPMAAARTP